MSLPTSPAGPASPRPRTDGEGPAVAKHGSGDAQSAAGAWSLRKVAVVGSGTMGGGIAQAAAQAGFDVALVDSDSAVVQKALGAMETRLRKAVELGKIDEGGAAATFGRVSAAASLEDAVRAADLVVEAVPEDVDLKRAIFQRVTAAAPAHALLASNTSSIPIKTIAVAADPRRTLGLHFFNPVHAMALVEIVAPVELAASALASAKAFVASLGKEAIVVRDSPGFATSRLGVALGLEAIRMLEDGVASAPDIDRAMELGYRHPMGPLRLTDLVGLDVRLKIADNLHQELGSEAFRAPALLRRLVTAGSLGQKSGRGFYVWRDGKAVAPAELGGGADARANDEPDGP